MEFEGELYGDCAVKDIKRGYIEENDGYTCILCGEHFSRGQIYTCDGKLYEAFKAVEIHMVDKHQSVLNFLLGLDGNHMGVSSLQIRLMNFFAMGISDKEIADYLGVSGSTIRNHRYKLREKERQCRVFLALMELLEENSSVKDKKKPISLERYKNDNECGQYITEKERRKIIEKYMTPGGKIKGFPSYEKSKRVILEAVLEHFCIGRKYSEREINESLALICKDYRLLKEELISYDYLGRSNKGGVYWIKDYKKRA